MNHLKVRLKYSASRCIFNSLLAVSSDDETQRLMLDILLNWLAVIPSDPLQTPTITRSKVK